MRRVVNAALLLALLLPACNGGPSYWITGADEKGATLIVPPGRFTPGFTVTGIKEVIRVPNNRDMASLIDGKAMIGPEEEIAPEPEADGG